MRQNQDFNSKEKIFNSVIKYSLFLFLPAVTIQFFRTSFKGWPFVMYYLALMALSILIMYLSRNKILYQRKVLILIGLFLLLGFFAFLNFGLVSGGSYWVILASSLSAIFLDIKRAYFVLGLIISLIVVIGFLFTFEYLSIQLDVNEYNKSIYSWSSSVLAISFVMILIFHSIKMINQNNEKIQIQLNEKVQKLAVTDERFRKIFNAVEEALMFLDMNGNFIEVNDATCRLYGYSREELLTMTPQNLVTP